MTDIIERVAKAIYEAQHGAGQPYMGIILDWPKYLAQARAAIAAMPRTSPLRWVEAWHGREKADTPFGNFYAEHSRWGYCFNEYYDEDELSCDGIEDGKAKAQAEWDKRLEPIFRAMIDAALNTGGRDE